MTDPLRPKTHDRISDMRAALSAARDAGDITLKEYPDAELLKLREDGAASSAQAAGSAAAPMAGGTALPDSAARAASVADSMGDSDLVEENDSPCDSPYCIHTSSSSTWVAARRRRRRQWVWLRTRHCGHSGSQCLAKAPKQRRIR